MSDFEALVVSTRFSLLLFCAIASAAPPAPSPIDMAQAKAAFAEAEAASNKEGGRLWGNRLSEVPRNRRMGHARRDGRRACTHRFQPRDGGGTQRHKRSASRRTWLDARTRTRVEHRAGSESRKLHRREELTSLSTLRPEGEGCPKGIVV